MKYCSTIFLIFSLLLSCNYVEKGYSKEEKTLLNDTTLPIDIDTKKVFILTEKECPTCNKEFALFMEKNLSDSTSLFIINASGLQVDISAFENSQNNVVRTKSKDIFFQRTKAIILKNKKIDTIITLNVREKKHQLMYLNSL